MEQEDLSDWLFEWKWDGIRAQVVKRAGKCFLWSRGEELINDSFPDLVQQLSSLPDGVVMDGELLPGRAREIEDFQTLQKRLNRKRPSKQMQKANPVFLMAYDLLECRGQDLRETPLSRRKAELMQLCERYPDCFALSASLPIKNLEQAQTIRERAREHNAEGMMLKHKDSPYLSGRKRGHWWKWKLEPLTFDGVLLYAQSGHGRRANLFTDFTFAVWKGEELVPVAKAYSGLTDQELIEVDRWIKKHTKDKFGPVRSVTPELVFEVAFEQIWRSSRHKSGLAMRFPRIKRWRKDKKVDEADTLQTLESLLVETS